jgi:hypothetical protein
MLLVDAASRPAADATARHDDRLDASRGGSADPSLQRDATAQADSGSHLTDAASSNTAVVDCRTSPASFPSFVSSCTQDADCAIAVRLSDCCGSRLATGIRSDQRAAFQSAAQTCDSQWLPCGCLGERLQVDDGMTLERESGLPVEVHCEANQCRTHLLASADGGALAPPNGPCSRHADCGAGYVCRSYLVTCADQRGVCVAESPCLSVESCGANRCAESGQTDCHCYDCERGFLCAQNGSCFSCLAVP